MSLNDRLEAFFRSHPNEWLDGRVLATVAGAYAWRSRTSDVRRRGLDIQNRVRTVAREDGSSYQISEYCFKPPVGQLELAL